MGREVKEYGCLDCDEEFDTADEMNDHIDTAHNENYGLHPAKEE